MLSRLAFHNLLLVLAVLSYGAHIFLEHENIKSPLYKHSIYLLCFKKEMFNISSVDCYFSKYEAF